MPFKRSCFFIYLAVFAVNPHPINAWGSEDSPGVSDSARNAESPAANALAKTSKRKRFKRRLLQTAGVLACAGIFLAVDAEYHIHQPHQTVTIAPAPDGTRTPAETSTLSDIEKNYLLNAPDVATLNQRLQHAHIDVGPGEEPLTNLEYDPTLWTLAAAYSTTAPAREGDYEHVVLEYPKSADPSKQYYQKGVDAYFLKSTTGSKQLFVNFNASYSTFGTGTWTNKTVDILNRYYNKPNIVVFPGYLSPDGELPSGPRIPDLTGDLVAQDLWQRLTHDPRFSDFSEVGLIGFSGGANLVMASLAIQDSRSYYNLGGIAFSPILNPRLAFENLDDTAASNASHGTSVDKGLTTKDREIIKLALQQKAWNNLVPRSARIEPITPVYFLKLAGDDSPRALKLRNFFVPRFGNEFVCVDCKHVTEATPGFKWLGGVPSAHHHSGPIDEGSGYVDYFRYFVFNLAMKDGEVAPGNQVDVLDPDTAKVDAAFDRHTSPVRQIALVNKNLYIVIAPDDPVLAYSGAPGVPNHSQRLTDTIHQIVALHNHHVRVFYPNQGSHMGYALTPFWEDVVGSYYKPGQDGYFH